MLITNSPVSSMLLSVSFVSRVGSTRGPTLMQSMGGLRSVQ